MSEKYSIRAEVVSQEKIAAEIYRLVLRAPEIAAAARPGQFISLYSNDKSRLLPRPISLCGIDAAGGLLTLVYRIAGAGTEEFSRLEAGSGIDVLGPLGNGFPVERAEGRRAVLFGGGIGIPPMLELSRQIKGEKAIVLGYRDELFLTEEFTRTLTAEPAQLTGTPAAEPAQLTGTPAAEPVRFTRTPAAEPAACGCAGDMKESGSGLYIATEDGSCGTKGNVLDCVRENAVTGDVIYACGPTPMLRAIKAWAQENGIECYLSLEQRMACGIGACLACVCRSTQTDAHSQVHNKRVCAEGPVFAAEEVEL